MVEDTRLIAKMGKVRGTFEIIAYLYRNEEACVTKLIDDIDVCQTTVYRAVDALLSLNLISEEQELTFPKKKTYSLAPRGLALVESPIYEWDRISRRWGSSVSSGDTSKN